MRGCLRQTEEDRWTIEDVLELLDLEDGRSVEEIFEIRHPQQAKELRDLMAEINRIPSEVGSSHVVKSEVPAEASDVESRGSSYLSCEDPVIAKLLAPQSREEAILMRQAALSVPATSAGNGRDIRRDNRIASIPDFSGGPHTAPRSASLQEYALSERHCEDHFSSESRGLTEDVRQFEESHLRSVASHHNGQIPTPRSAALTLIEATSRSVKDVASMASLRRQDKMDLTALSELADALYPLSNSTADSWHDIYGKLSIPVRSLGSAPASRTDLMRGEKTCT